MEYVDENAIPLKASEAVRGEPSPEKVLATTAVDPRNKERRASCSVRESSVSVFVVVIIVEAFISTSLSLE